MHYTAIAVAHVLWGINASVSGFGILHAHTHSISYRTLCRSSTSSSANPLLFIPLSASTSEYSEEKNDETEKQQPASSTKAAAADVCHYRNLLGTKTRLDLGSKNIGDDGGKALAETLKVNKSLTSLHLSFNKIGDEGGKALAEALKENKSLTSLD
eukprot:CAMPEP_0194305408 /NCGR_PEP_ID=MMETSP0171-20130528/2858_1 /TAXON_ID=218684 /ORGANISM="Corethron pennatum, Strain L29A3" /LENGTH=155 /DNA_ID=CAMNT_0039056931 /DNA_START=72 /DNA_END=536 /DNA_ORIENTATION=-